MAAARGPAQLHRPAANRAPALRVEARAGGMLVAHFHAMGSPCELLADGADQEEFAAAAELVAQEAWRIECKFSRFSDRSVLASLRRRAGSPARLDAETAGLIDVAALWHARSAGLFDITGGALQRLWRFGAASAPPQDAALARTLAHVGFGRLRWRRPVLTLPPGMELDFDGIAKEYAVDRAHELLGARLSAPALVNFGGDLRVTRAPRRGHWRVGLESAAGQRSDGRIVALSSGALATSGDVRRHVDWRGRRYGHLLDPRTGWPVPGAPAAVSVAAPTCLESGLLAKLALLHGSGAAEFLATAGARCWVTPAQQDAAA